MITGGDDYVSDIALCDWERGFVFVSRYTGSIGRRLYQIDIRNPAVAAKLLYTSPEICFYMGHVDDVTSIWAVKEIGSYCVAYINNYNFDTPDELIPVSNTELPAFGMQYVVPPGGKPKTIMPRFLIGKIYWWDTKNRKRVALRVQYGYRQNNSLSSTDSGNETLQIGNSYRHVLVRAYVGYNSIGQAHMADADLTQYPVMTIIESREEDA